jgi:hypothetical protein
MRICSRVSIENCLTRLKFSRSKRSVSLFSLSSTPTHTLPFLPSPLLFIVFSNLPHACMLPATCSCNMHHAPRTHTLHHAPCTMHHLRPCSPVTHGHSCEWLIATWQHQRVVRTFLAHPLGDAIIEIGTRADTPVAVVALTIPLGLVPPLGGRPSALPPPHTIATVSSSHRPSMRLFHPAQATKAHRSVLYAWPQTLTTPGSAIPRHFGMEPKPDVRRATKGGSSPLQAPPCAATGTAVE